MAQTITWGWFKLAELALRCGIGAAFIYAGWLKAGDPAGFADSVASFALLPRAWVNPFALALPIFEMGGSLLLIVGWPKRIGALALMLLTAVFCLALIAAMARGLTINCGCFGPSASTTDPLIDLARDLLIILGCAMLYDPVWVKQWLIKG